MSTTSPQQSDLLASKGQSPDALSQLLSRLDEKALRNLVGLLPISTSTESADTTTVKFLAFAIGPDNYAVPLDNVVEILRMPPITHLPHVPEWLRGVFNLRGEIVSVVQLGRLLELAASEPTPEQRLIVLRSTEEEIVVGFVVDGIVGLRAIDPAGMNVVSEREAGSFARYLRGWFERDKKLLPVFDVERLLADPTLRQFDVTSAS